MAEQTSNRERAAESSLNDTPKAINKATLIMAIGGILLVIIAAVILMTFYRNDTNKGNSNASTSSNRAVQ